MAKTVTLEEAKKLMRRQYRSLYARHAVAFAAQGDALMTWVFFKCWLDEVHNRNEPKDDDD